MKPAVKITIAYLLVGYCWIFFSDRALLWITGSDTVPALIGLQTAKGLIYVSVTGILLYFLVRHYLDQIESKVIELKKLNRQLETHAGQLKQSNAELEQFAYTASHDLQEPLRMISAFMAQLDKKYHEQLDEKAHQYIYFAIDGAKRMRKILIDLLEYSRIGRIYEETSPIDVEGIVSECLAELRHKIQEKEAQIHLDITCSGFIWDANLFRMIIHQLLDNSLKFARPEVAPEITVACYDSDNEWVLAVKDNGIGIDREYFEKIFVIFQRLHPSSAYEGSGIGLASVKKAVEFHKGKIQVTATPGEGSTFTLIFPKKIASSSAA
ncbi:sensor histidine kinase [Lunatimonas salinarum]|uniref:sensor histidine kinase n=1 Tax=Lunatimonas salinarum TaxID=1774590 RepID=UPI001AE04216|nr:ATP-binding protein [Lunatimonas salinarum]